eukprot:scaffold150626_cov50-Prasinocladus_malaysianus.AAC.4
MPNKSYNCGNMQGLCMVMGAGCRAHIVDRGRLTWVGLGNDIFPRKFIVDGKCYALLEVPRQQLGCIDADPICIVFPAGQAQSAVMLTQCC